jgi:aminodeoxyfutalosine deaminase
MLRPLFPKIELHVHLEATVQPKALLEIARRNGFALPGETEDDLVQLYRYKDFEHFLDLWLLTTPALQTEADFRQVVVAYGEEAMAQGAVYIEGIFTPVERVSGGASWDEVFSGFCDGAAEAKERFGVEIRLTTDISRNLDLDVAIKTARYSVKYRERGIVGLGLGGPKRPTLQSHSNVPSSSPRTADSVRSHTPEKRPGRSRSVELSRSSKPTGSDTASEPLRTAVCCAS